MKHNFKDLTGLKQGCFTVVSHAGSTSNGGAKWLVHCDVTGNDSVRAAGIILAGSLSCKYCRPKVAGIKKRKHGHAVGKTTPTYNCWIGMHARCNDINHQCYAGYGGRGIKVCSEWDDYSTFLKDMGERPGNGLSIERIDNNKGYSKDNCKWATMMEQSNNRRSNKYLNVDGKMMTYAQCSRKFGIPKTTIRRRVALGMTTGEVLTPPKKYNYPA